MSLRFLNCNLFLRCSGVLPAYSVRSTGSDSTKTPPPSSGVKRHRTVRLKVAKRPYPKIYTRTGDTGSTSLFTGERRLKSDNIFEALGTLDELSSHIGSAYTCSSEAGHAYADLLIRTQCMIQDIASNVATPHSSAKETHISKTTFSSENVREVENWIDHYSRLIPPLENFILPGGGVSSSFLHISRAVCRRAERKVTPLVKANEVDPECLRYLNRLSDFLFVAARFASQFDKKIETVYYQASKKVDNYEAGPDSIWKRTKPED